MIKKKILITITNILFIGLVACNNNADNALDDNMNNGFGALENRNNDNDDILNTRDNNGLIGDRHNVTDNDRLFGTRNTNSDDGMFGTRNNNIARDNGDNGLFGNNDRNNGDNGLFGNNDGNNGNTGLFGNNDRNNGGNDGLFTNNARNNGQENGRNYTFNDSDLGDNFLIGDQNQNGTISSDKTQIPSSKYPHTKAVKVQEAKYKFIKHGKGNGQQKNFSFQRQKQNNNAEQQSQAPAQQQPVQPKQQEPKQQQQPAQQQQAPTEQNQQQQGGSATPPKQTAPAQGISAAEAKVIELTNAARRKNGLPDLQADTTLSNVAREKSTDMQKNNYFSHTSPSYGSPFDMMRDFGVTYKTAGENIAQGQPTPEQVVQAWMNSEGHRKNILSKDFTHIGVGYQKSGNHWTQMFIGK